MKEQKMSIREYCRIDDETRKLCGFKRENYKNLPLTKKQLNGLHQHRGYSKAHTPIIEGKGIPYQGGGFSPR